jgi:hypothetical protein
MRKTSLSLVLAFLCFSPAAGAGETRMTGAEITAALSDHTLGGKNADNKSWQQIFQKGGVTYYSADGAQSQGVWAVRGDQYCSQWPPNESWTCYDLMTDGKAYSFVSASGGRTTGTLLN